MNRVGISVSLGDVLDRLSILGIKSEKTGINEVHYAYNALKAEFDSWKDYRGSELDGLGDSITELYAKLLAVNLELWDLENEFADLLAGDYTYEDLAKTAIMIKVRNRDRANIKWDADKLAGHVTEIKRYGAV